MKGDSERPVQCNRRKLITGAMGAGAVSLIPNVTSASSLGDNPRGGSSDISVSLIVEKEDYKLYKIINDGSVSLGKFYTDGPKKGEIIHLDLEDENVDINVETNEQEDISINQVEALQAVEAQGHKIVKRSKNVSRELGPCDQDFCDGFTYTHVQTGFTVEFVDHISSFEGVILGEAIAMLAEVYLESKISKWVIRSTSAIVGLLSLVATGTRATISPWDHDKCGWLRGCRPAVEIGVAEGWDVHANNLTNVQDNEHSHIGGLDPRCG